MDNDIYDVDMVGIYKMYADILQHKLPTQIVNEMINECKGKSNQELVNEGLKLHAAKEALEDKYFEITSKPKSNATILKNDEVSNDETSLYYNGHLI